MTNASDHPPAPIILYGHAACPMIHPVRGMLKQARVKLTYIDIHADLAACQRVRDINDGYESVPTLVFPDGSTLTEPSGGVLKAKLEAMGYDVPLRAWLMGSAYQLLIAVAAIFALLRLAGVI